MLKFMLLFLFLVFGHVSGKDFFITPKQSCALTCSGDETQPFDNLISAINATKSEEEVTLNLLKDSDNPHYVFLREQDVLTRAVYYDMPEGSIVVTSKSFKIKPLFCDEEAAQSKAL